MAHPTSSARGVPRRPESQVSCKRSAHRETSLRRARLESLTAAQIDALIRPSSSLANAIPTDPSSVTTTDVTVLRERLLSNLGPNAIWFRPGNSNGDERLHQFSLAPCIPASDDYGSGLTPLINVTAVSMQEENISTTTISNTLRRIASVSETYKSPCSWCSVPKIGRQTWIGSWNCEGGCTNATHGGMAQLAFLSVGSVLSNLARRTISLTADMILSAILNDRSSESSMELVKLIMDHPMEIRLPSDDIMSDGLRVQELKEEGEELQENDRDQSFPSHYSETRTPVAYGSGDDMISMSSLLDEIMKLSIDSSVDQSDAEIEDIAMTL